MVEHFQPRMSVVNQMPIAWTAEEKEILRRDYPRYGPAVVAKMVGKSPASVRCAVHRSGLLRFAGSKSAVATPGARPADDDRIGLWCKADELIQAIHECEGYEFNFPKWRVQNGLTHDELFQIRIIVKQKGGLLSTPKELRRIPRPRKRRHARAEPTAVPDLPSQFDVDDDEDKPELIAKYERIEREGIAEVSLEHYKSRTEAGVRYSPSERPSHAYEPPPADPGETNRAEVASLLRAWKYAEQRRDYSRVHRIIYGRPNEGGSQGNYNDPIPESCGD